MIPADNFKKTFHMAIKHYFLLILLCPWLCFISSPAESQTTDRVKKFRDNYGLMICPDSSEVSNADTDGDSSEEEDSPVSSCEPGEPYFANLRTSCEDAKLPATECCENPSACSSVMASLATNILPALPGLISTVKGIKINKQVNKGQMSVQEAQEQLCNIDNRVQMGSYAGSLLSQLMPMFQKGCAKKIKQCKQSCDNNVKNFKADFFDTYRFYYTDGKKFHLAQANDSMTLIKIAKNCVFGDSNEEFEMITFEGNQSDPQPKNKTDKKNSQSVTAPSFGGCVWDESNESPYKILLPQGQKQQAQDCSPPSSCSNINGNHKAVKILSSILFAAKAYYNTTGVSPEVRQKTRPESFRFTEKEIVDCGHQPDRVVDKVNRPGGPVPPPIMKMCRDTVEKAVQEQKTGRTPTVAPNSVPTTTGSVGASSFAGGDLNKQASNPLLFPPGTNRDLFGDFDDGDERPLAPQKLPSWAEGSTGSLAGGGTSGGGALPSGSGGGGSDGDGEYPYGDVLPPGSGDLSSNFAGDGFYGDGEGYNEADSKREVAVAQADDTEDDMENHGAFKGGENLGTSEDSMPEQTIFNLASHRIQNFCADRNCSH